MVRKVTSGECLEKDVQDTASGMQAPQVYSDDDKWRFATTVWTPVEVKKVKEILDHFTVFDSFTEVPSFTLPLPSFLVW